jgi:hypothetical protein
VSIVSFLARRRTHTPGQELTFANVGIGGVRCRLVTAVLAMCRRSPIAGSCRRDGVGLAELSSHVENQANQWGDAKMNIEIGLADAVKAVLLGEHDTPMSPAQIRDSVKVSYPHLYSTPAHLAGIAGGNYQNEDMRSVDLLKTYDSSRSPGDPGRPQNKRLKWVEATR